MRRQRNTKIIATLGPASASPAEIRALFEAGADTFRINMSHGDREAVRERIEIIRAVEAEAGRAIGILADLQGPKLRVGTFAGGAADLAEGAAFYLDRDPVPGDHTRVSFPHEPAFKVLGPGAEVLLDDGRIRLEVRESTANRLETVVRRGGRITDHKGVNLPSVLLPLTALTEKDRSDLDFVLEHEVDWIGLSFIQRPEDIQEVRKIVSGRALILAKIEKPAAFGRLGEIIEMADAIMVARGDLGVELPVERVPGIQKSITRAARAAGLPVVIATQMLESMIHAPAPTRAEVSDVATAVYDGADAVMLSAETAVGKFPCESVSVMNRVVEEAERDALYRSLLEAQRAAPEATSADAISAAAHQVAETLKVAAIVCYTTSGSTGLRAARERPNVPVLALTPNAATARRLSLVWGLHCALTEDATSFDDMVEKACRIAIRDEFAKSDERVVITAGVPFGTPGATNVLRIAWAGGDHRSGRARRRAGRLRTG